MAGAEEASGRNSMAHTIRKVGVIGAGQMGNGIAHVCALAGLDVKLNDVAPDRIKAAIATVNGNMARQVMRNRIAEDERQAALSRISAADKLDGLADCDLVIEAATEKEEVKRKILTALCPVLKPDTIIGSNTSSISITRLAASTDRPEKFIGIHFMNPVPVMVLIEVIRALQTSDETFHTTMALCERLEKKPVAVNDAPGFVSNRVLLPMINEAAFAVMEGVATAEAVDAILKMGMNHPMGPLELADFIGLDTCVHILDVLQEGFGDSKYRACPLLRKMVAAGWLGRKSGRGFYAYAG